MSSSTSSNAVASNDGAKRRRIEQQTDEESSRASAVVVLSAASSSSSAAASGSLQSDPHLPPDVLARILNYMLYGDVRKFLLAGKVVAMEAAKQVSVLNITRVEQLNIPAAKKRFLNVEEVNIFCLEYRVEKPNEENDWRALFSICTDTAISIVPFLQIFPKLKCVYVGGAETPQGPFSTAEEWWYHLEEAYMQDDHAKIMEGLVLSFCGAFRTGILSQNLELRGIVSDLRGGVCQTYWCANYSEEDSFRKCTLCRSICKHFPPRYVLESLFGSSSEGYCMRSSYEEALEIIAKRPDGMQYLRSKESFIRLFQHKCVYTYMCSYYKALADFSPSFDKEDEMISSFLEKGIGDIYVAFLPSDDRAKMGKLVSNYGLRIRDINSDENALRQIYQHMIPELSQGKRHLLDKNTYDFLVSIGLNIDLNVFEVTDEDAESVAGISLLDFQA